MLALRLFVVSLLFASVAQAKPETVKWSIELPETAKIVPGAVIEVRIEALIKTGLHIGSLSQPEGGPRGTEITFPEKQPFALTSAIVAPAPQRKHDETFGMDVEYYTGIVTFLAKLKVRTLTADNRRLLIDVSYQACSSDNCYLPSTIRLSKNF